MLINSIYAKKQQEFIDIDISFLYEGNQISTSNNCGLIWVGYKYYILHDSVSNTSYFYETEKMANIEYIHREKTAKSAQQ